MESNLGSEINLDLESDKPTLWCVGRNYADHAKEMQQTVPAEPLIFLKAGACLTQKKQVPLPAFSQEIHHEIELAVKLGPDLKPSLIALALDLTARDAQAEAKKRGQPWTLAKSFYHSCPVSPWFTYQGDKWFALLEFSLHVNGELRQKGCSAKMIFNLPSILTFLRSRFPVQPGDIVLTGTPSGVGPLRIGDRSCAEMMGFKWIVDFVATDSSVETVSK